MGKADKPRDPTASAPAAEPDPSLLRSPHAKALHIALEALDTLRSHPQLVQWFPKLGRFALDTALGIPGPDGDPAVIADIAHRYAEASHVNVAVVEDLSVISSSSLPAAWRGRAGETAGQAIGGLIGQVSEAYQTYEQGAFALGTFATKLTTAKNRDSAGAEQLRIARQHANGSPSQQQWVTILSDAATGCHTRLTAAVLRDGAADDLNTLLGQLTANARAHTINSPGIDPLTAVLLSYTGDVGASAYAPNQILTPAQLQRASQLLDSMSAADRAAFESMLAGARSPQEAAYLWKALAAGYSVKQLGRFDTVIRPHGNDPSWLSNHLNPHLGSQDPLVGPDGKYTPGYRGQTGTTTPDRGKPGWVYNWDFYSQRDVPDCVAASTVMARAQSDPVYMLGLTTGQGPMGGSHPGDDRPATVAQRVQDAYRGNYDASGKDPAQNAKVLLNSTTGNTYTTVSTGTAASRQSVLPQVEAALDQGKPVPVDVVDPGSTSAHQMMIIAAQGDDLEIYNPWGYTEWVTKEQFVNGQLGDLTGKSPTDGLPTAYQVLLPQ
ncbi:hypothetical protein [Nocardia sp. alder85J]|uniref:hypothetical protein n=1 Tax=Nocardia sp. alder85J TaxID=2862949 RepID=UPI001CD2DA25|nr:hypothetical protein [Nocardia sp. alder85J]MCX4092929.1 hypothetical protein [Nocardia sp. alder85J]